MLNQLPLSLYGFSIVHQRVVQKEEMQYEVSRGVGVVGTGRGVGCHKAKSYEMVTSFKWLNKISGFLFCCKR